MNDRQKMLRSLSAIEFAAHELHVYLDTHPDDRSAAAALAHYSQRSQRLRSDFENKFGPLTPSEDGNRWAWIADPWPWNNEEE